VSGRRGLGWVVVLVVVVAMALGSNGDDGDASARERPERPDRTSSADGREQSDRADRADRERRQDGSREREARERERGGSAGSDGRQVHVVVRVVDGDTLELGNGETVRLVGIDTPEVGECGHERASRRLEELVLGRQVRLGESDEDRDGYGRLLRYVDAGEVDAGLRLIREGLAIARYDSRDGYGFHPREPEYVAADRGTRPAGCPAAAPQPLMGGGGGSTGPGGGCAPGYQPCVPAYPPDLDCADVGGPVTVAGPDPHALDGDGDGRACE
jgi:endonuclease YncB( thermonuclease family)